MVSNNGSPETGAPCSTTTTSAPAAASGAGSSGPSAAGRDRVRGRRHPPGLPRSAAAPSSSADTRARPGSTRTAMTREAPRSAVRRSPGGTAAGSGRAVKAPRRVSSADGLVDLRVDRTVEDPQGAVVLQGPRRPDLGRAAGVPPRPRPEPAASIRVSRSGATAARPAGSTLHGSQRRSATERTAGSASSTSCVAVVVLELEAPDGPRSSSRRTPLAKGRSSSSASSGPTWPVSPSMELRPSSTRSKGPAARRTAARARAVASVSEPAKAGSQACRPASAPQATASRRTSSASGRPERHHGAACRRCPGPA